VGTNLTIGHWLTPSHPSPLEGEGEGGGSREGVSSRKNHEPEDLPESNANLSSWTWER